MPGYKAILWDNDGVLVDTEHLYRDATRTIMARAGFELSDEHYRELFLSQNHGAWHLLAERGHTESAITQMRAQRDDLYSELLRERNHTISGVEEVLQNLHGRYAMGVVTSSQRRHFEIIHSVTGLLRLFRFRIDPRGLCATPSPIPSLIWQASHEPGCAADECIAVEDTPRGLTAALGAGLKCIVIPNAPHCRRGLSSAAHQVLREYTANCRPLLDR